MRNGDTSRYSSDRKRSFDTFFSRKPGREGRKRRGRVKNISRKSLQSCTFFTRCISRVQHFPGGNTRGHFSRRSGRARFKGNPADSRPKGGGLTKINRTALPTHGILISSGFPVENRNKRSRDWNAPGTRGKPVSRTAGFPSVYSVTG